MTEERRGDAPTDVVERLRAICLTLPEAVEEIAWVGLRWSVKKKAFAHVVTTEPGWPPVYARVLGDLGPATVLTFESSGGELVALRNADAPFFAPSWRPTIVGLVIDGDTDWDEVAELLTESYCVHAPATLVEQVNRPG